MDGWTDRWMGGWMDGWMDDWMDGWMDGRTDGRTDGWMDGWAIYGSNHNIPQTLLLNCVVIKTLSDLQYGNLEARTLMKDFSVVTEVIVGGQKLSEFH